MKPAPLDAALDALVAQWAGPASETGDASKPVVRRLRTIATARATALRRAWQAIEATRAEGWRVVSTANGSYVATVGCLYRSRRERDGTAIEEDLARLAAALQTAADTHEAVATSVPLRATTRGRRPDALLDHIVRQVAYRCLEHGVRFTQSTTSEAAQRLARVLARLAWAPTLSPEGLRRYLRRAREVQGAALARERAVTSRRRARAK